MMSCLLRWLCALALLGALGACGDDSASDADGGANSGDGDGDQTPEPVEVTIEADVGGEIETTGAAIDIPGGALSADTEITLEVLLAGDFPDPKSIVSFVYDFGPDGTQFDEPVELTIELVDQVPDGMEASMAWLDEATDTWTKLDDSRRQGDEVIATIEHFTKFAIVLTAGGQTAGACTDFADFEACGGDLDGTWEFALACADVTAESLFGDENPFPDCTGLEVRIDVELSGTITFESTAEGGEYESSITRSGEFGLNIPSSCLTTAGIGCDMLADEEKMTAATLVGDVCEVVTTQPEESKDETGTFELEGLTIIMTDAATGEADPPAQYCVQGDVITVRIVDVDEDGKETITFMQAMRQ